MGRNGYECRVPSQVSASLATRHPVLEKDVSAAEWKVIQDLGNARLATLGDAYRQVGGHLVVNDAVSVDGDGKIQPDRGQGDRGTAVPGDLRKRTAAMLPLQGTHRMEEFGRGQPQDEGQARCSPARWFCG